MSSDDTREPVHSQGFAPVLARRGTIIGSLRPLAAAVRATCSGATLPLWLVGAVPLACSALTLGPLTVESRLGQPFSGWVSVETGASDPLEAGCLTLDAGSAGTSGLPALPHASLELEPWGEGHRLRLRTRERVLEPVVGVALTVRCADAPPATREYTVVLDLPPGVLGTATPLAAPVRPARRVSRPADPSGAVPRPALTRPLPPAPRRPDGGAAGASDPRQDGFRVVTTAPGDTLYGIATRLYPAGSTGDRWRLVQAIVAANPEVFPDRNPDRLPAGVSLQVPVPAPAPELAPSTSAARAPDPPGRASAPAPVGGQLRILSAEEEASLAGESGPAGGALPVPGVPATPVGRVDTNPGPLASPGPGSATGPEPAGVAAAPRTRPAFDAATAAHVREQLVTAQARLQSLTSEIARLNREREAARRAAPTVTLPAPQPALASPGQDPAAPAAAAWYVPVLSLLLGLSVAFPLTRWVRSRRRSAAVAIAPFLPRAGEPTRGGPRAASQGATPPPPATGGRTRPSLRLAAAAEVEGAPVAPATPSASVHAGSAGQPPGVDPRVEPAAVRELAAFERPTPFEEPSAFEEPPPGSGASEPGPAEDGVTAMHRLLLEAELHLLFDQGEEARGVLEQAIEADSDERPDLRPWTMLFDVLRAAGDRKRFESYGHRFRRRYNVAPPTWVRPEAATPAVGLAERFPHVLDRIIQVWGTREGLKLLNGLLLDDRGGTRQGFDFEVGEEIGFLRDLLVRRGVDDLTAPAGQSDEGRRPLRTAGRVP